MQTKFLKKTKSHLRYMGVLILNTMLNKRFFFFNCMCMRRKPSFACSLLITHRNTIIGLTHLWENVLAFDNTIQFQIVLPTIALDIS